MAIERTDLPSVTWGDYVYFPEEDWRAVTRAVLSHYPPGTVLWGTNRAASKQGYWYVQGDNQIPMERIVRAAVRDETTMEVLDGIEGARLEAAFVIENGD